MRIISVPPGRRVRSYLEEYPQVVALLAELEQRHGPPVGRGQRVVDAVGAICGHKTPFISEGGGAGAAPDLCSGRRSGSRARQRSATPG